MLRVVLADDEVHIRNLLKYLIHWEEHGLQLIADYETGRDVAEHVREDRPDLIISDIKMPGMDGLEMIRSVKAILPECRFIIISGFRDFEFAKQAVRLGVMDYILKPVDEDELNGTLAEMVKEISTEEPEEPRGLNRQDFLPAIRGQGHAGTISDVNKTYGFHFAETGTFYILWLQFCRRPPQMAVADAAKRVMQRVHGCLEEYLNDGESYMVSGQAFIGMIQVKENREAGFLRELDSAYREVLDEEKAAIAPMTIYLSCGNGVNDIAEIHDSYDCAKFFIGGRFGYGEGRVYIADTQVNKRYWIKDSYTLRNETIKRFCSAIENREEALALRITEEAFRTYENSGENNWTLFVYISYQLADALTQMLNNLGVTTSEAMSLRSVMEQWNENTDTIDGLVSNTQKMISQVMHQYLSDSKEDSHAVIQYARDYIDKHYADDITLALLADKININPTYLSAVFKETTGINYSSYLTAVRVEHAKELLRDIDMNLSEVASAVGYNSTRYFTRIFKQETGIKPSEYRRLNLKKMNW